MFQPENAIKIKAFFDDKSDFELYKLMPFMEFMSGLKDVRDVRH